MGKIPMESSSGDLGAKAAEDALKTTPAGKGSQGHMPNLGMAVNYMNKNDIRKMGADKDCM